MAEKRDKKSGLVVIMGPTSSGKSSVLKEIGRRGYNIYEEIPKQVLSERKDCIKEGDSEEKVKKEIETRERIMYKRQNELENNLLEKGGINFIERSLVGVFAFADFYLGHVPKDFDMEQNLKDRYLRVFNLKDLGDFEKESTRVEKSKEEAEEAQKTVLGYYDFFGINYQDVPVFSKDEKRNIEKRANFILENLNLPY